LVKKYNKPLSDEIDLEAKCKELESKIKKLQEENDGLKIKVDELENDKPNTKSFNYYKQLAMGTLALLYGDEQVRIWRSWANNTIPDKDDSDLKLNFTVIQDDLDSLNAKGIKIKRDAIISKIKESIYLLAPK
jgi:hypothetical protein